MKIKETKFNRAMNTLFGTVFIAVIGYVLLNMFGF